MLNRQNKNTPRRPVADRGNAPVFSYYASRSASDANLGRYEQPKSTQTRTIKWQLLPTWISLIAIAISAIYLSTLTDSPRIVLTDNPGAVSRQQSVYQAKAQQLLRSSVLNHSKLSIDTNGIAKELQSAFPELDAVTVTVPVFARRPVIQLEAAVPPFALSSTTGVYYIRADGTAMVSTADLAAPKMPLTVIDQSGIPVSPGKTVLTKATVSFIAEVIRQLQAKQLVIDQLTLPNSPNELQVKLKGQPYYIRFDNSGDARQQAGTFLAVKQKLDGDKVTPKQYIDVRVEERAYYR